MEWPATSTRPSTDRAVEQALDAGDVEVAGVVEARLVGPAEAGQVGGDQGARAGEEAGRCPPSSGRCHRARGGAAAAARSPPPARRAGPSRAATVRRSPGVGHRAIVAQGRAHRTVAHTARYGGRRLIRAWRCHGVCAGVKVAVVGAGVSGLVAAYLLHRDHDVTVFEAGEYAGGHVNTIPVDVESGRYEVDTGLHRLQRAQLPQLPPPAAAAAHRRAGLRHELQRQLAPRRLRVRQPGCQRHLRQALPPGAAALLPDARREGALPPRGPAACSSSSATAPPSASSSTRGATRAPSSTGSSSPRWRRCGRRRRRRRAPFPPSTWPASSTTTGCSRWATIPRWSTVPGGSARYVEAMTRTFRRKVRLQAPVVSIRARRGLRRDPPAQQRAGDLRQGHRRHPLRPGAAHAQRRHAARARAAQRLRVPDQRGGASHRRARAAAAPPRVGELELPGGGPGHRQQRGDVPHEPSAVDRLTRAVLRHAQQPRGHRQHQDRAPAALPASRLHAPQRQRAGPARDRFSAPIAPISAAHTGAMGSTRMAWTPRCASPRTSVSGSRDAA